MTALTSAEILQVLKGARHRLAVGKPGTEECCCTKDLMGDKTPYPAPEASQWCFLCAVDAERDVLKIDNDGYGEALAELAFDLSGHRFTLAQWTSRDGALFDAFEDADQPTTLQAFDTTIRRLEAA